MRIEGSNSAGAGWLIAIGKLILGGLAVLTSIRYGTGVYVWKQTEKLERPTYTVLQKLAKGIELRRYEPYLIAETTVEEQQQPKGSSNSLTKTTDAKGDTKTSKKNGGKQFRQPTADGFRVCAQYIFGKNKPRNRTSEGEKMAMTAPVRVSGTVTPSPPVVAGEKMAMTAPVRSSTQKKTKTKVSFVIGSQYTLATAPKPMDKNVRLRQVKAHTLAVKFFSGPPPSDDRVQRERAKLELALQQANIKPPKSDDETLVYGYHDPFITPNILRRNEVAVVIEGRV